MSTQIIQIYLSDGTSKNVRVDSFTTVQRIVNVVLDGLGMDRLSFGHFALRLACFSGGLGSIASDSQWLHPLLRMPEIAHRYIAPLTSGLQMRFELRIRFIPRGLHEMYQTQMAAFLYLYDQLVSDYIHHISWKIESEKAFYMGALILRKRFPNLTSQNVEKKLDFGLIDEEGGLLKYFPESIVVTTKKKHLHKQVISALKEVMHLSELEAVFKFMKNLMSIARFDTEIFRVSFGTFWDRPVELYIGQHFGISYMNQNTKEPVSLADLRNVISVSVRRMDAKSEKCVLKIKISGAASPLLITTSTINIAESLAHLIDGYQMILSQQRSVWLNQDLKGQSENEVSNKSSETLSPLVRRKCVVQPSKQQNTNVESASLMHSMHIDPSCVRLEELLGSGQYGNVYRGRYMRQNKRLQVAVKVCKTDSNNYEANKFLMEEAYTISRFHHKHIIQLVGISCANSIVWVVLELAPLGELRQYLKREQQSIELPTQLLFAKQLADSVAYLTQHSYVHRDLAARNVLVANPKSVKLSDFGMCRQLADEVYKSNSTKLPLKWMPYESLTYRKFTKESDVYMLAVCIWEILNYGEKPWQDTRNHEVVIKLERGEVLKKPDTCPLAVYQMLQEMWQLEPKQRMEIFNVYSTLKHFLMQIEQNVPPDDLVLYKTPKKASMANVAPILRIDAIKSVEPSLLQQTLEQQRAQSVEDDKWLQRQEQIASEEFAVKPSEPLDTGISDQTSDPVFLAISDVSNSIYEFTQSCSPINSVDFINAIEKILYQLEQLNDICIPHLEQLAPPYQKKIKFVQKLLNTNGNNLRKTMQALEESEPVAVENHHCEALRICNVMITHSKQFLCAINVARLSSGMSAFESLPQCQ